MPIKLSLYALNSLSLSYLTAVEMDLFAANTGADQPNSKKLQAFLDENWSWMKAQVTANATSEFWHQLGALLAQVEGLADGQTDSPAAKRSLGFAWVYNAIIQGGDIFNLGQVRLLLLLLLCMTYRACLLHDMLGACVGTAYFVVA